MDRRLRILHLVGSATSDFYRDLSFVYAGDCIEATFDPDRYEYVFACITPDQQWRIVEGAPRGGQCLDSILDADPMPIAEAVARLDALEIDVALPQMFCIAGMTQYRALLDTLQIPFVGNQADVMALTADKAKARAVVAAAGVTIPKGQVIGRCEFPSIPCPAVVKPLDADNSLGVSLVPTDAEYPEALENAFEHSDKILVEQFIEPGREVRCGIIDRADGLQCLPLQEYRLDASHPIRSYGSKLTTNGQGRVDLTSKYQPQSWMVDLDDPVVDAVWDSARKCHQALGCRDYSLFDFRIDPQGRPHFLEAGLYCSFAPKSIITSMVEATGQPLSSFLNDMLAQAIDRDTSLTHGAFAMSST